MSFWLFSSKIHKNQVSEGNSNVNCGGYFLTNFYYIKRHYQQGQQYSFSLYQTIVLWGMVGCQKIGYFSIMKYFGFIVKARGKYLLLMVKFVFNKNLLGHTALG